MTKKIPAEEIIALFDAKKWAEVFVNHVKEHEGVSTDIQTMEIWFANVMTAGYDKAKLEQTYEDSDFKTFAQYLDSLT